MIRGDYGHKGDYELIHDILKILDVYYNDPCERNITTELYTLIGELTSRWLLADYGNLFKDDELDDLSQEIVTDIIMRVYVKKKVFDLDQPRYFYTYVKRIVRGKTTDWIRSRAKRHNRMIEEAVDIQSEVAVEDWVDCDLFDPSSYSIVRSAVDAFIRRTTLRIKRHMLLKDRAVMLTFPVIQCAVRNKAHVFNNLGFRERCLLRHIVHETRKDYLINVVGKRS